MIFFKSSIRETPNLSTDTDKTTDTKRKPFFLGHFLLWRERTDLHTDVHTDKEITKNANNHSRALKLTEALGVRDLHTIVYHHCIKCELGLLMEKI